MGTRGSIAVDVPRNGAKLSPVQLDIRKILTILPHRYPFVMVDRVTEITPGQVCGEMALLDHHERIGGP